MNLGYSLFSSINGIDIKLSDNSSSNLGLQVSTTYKTELQQIKQIQKHLKHKHKQQRQEQMQQK